SLSFAIALVRMFHVRGNSVALILLLLGVLQPVQTFWATCLQIDVGHRVQLSPGSIILFPANLLLAMFLLLHRSNGRIDHRLGKLMIYINSFLCSLALVGAGLAYLGVASRFAVGDY